MARKVNRKPAKRKRVQPAKRRTINRKPKKPTRVDFTLKLHVWRDLQPTTYRACISRNSAGVLMLSIGCQYWPLVDWFAAAAGENNPARAGFTAREVPTEDIAAAVRVVFAKAQLIR